MPPPPILPAVESSPLELEGNLRARVRRGTLVTLSSYGANQVLRMASNLVLARLLAPEHFGSMVLVNVFLQGLTMFSDVGIAPSIIRSGRGDDPVFLNSAWTVQALRGLALFSCAALIAPGVARLYGEPGLASYLPVAGVAALVAGLDSTKLVTASRHLLLGRRTLIELVAQLASIAVMVCWALLQPSVWSLVAGGLANALTKCVLSHLALPGPRNRFQLEREACRELFGFGRWIFVSTAITFLALQVDRLLLGKLVPLGQLGVYGMAQQLAALPTVVLGALVGSIVFPMLSAAARSAPDSLPERADRTRAALLPCGLFAVLALVLLGPAFFRTLYDARYQDATWMVVALAAPLWFLILTQTADRALLVVGDTRALATCNAVSLAGKVAGCLVGFRLGGLAGFIVGSTLGTAAGHMVVQMVLWRHGIRILAQDVRATALLVLLGTAGVRLEGWLGAALEPRARTLLELGIAALVLVPLGLLAARRLRRSKEGA